MNKQMKLGEVVATLRDGMTIGIGGWGPRRKPMALVRALVRSPLRDLTIVSYGGPDVGMLCAAGKVKKVLAEMNMGSSVYCSPVPANGALFIVNRNQLFALSNAAGAPAKAATPQTK